MDSPWYWLRTTINGGAIKRGFINIEATLSSAMHRMSA